MNIHCYRQKHMKTCTEHAILSSHRVLQYYTKKHSDKPKRRRVVRAKKTAEEHEEEPNNYPPRSDYFRPPPVCICPFPSAALLSVYRSPRARVCVRVRARAHLSVGRSGLISQTCRTTSSRTSSSERLVRVGSA
jgi:hypothetical protein